MSDPDTKKAGVPSWQLKSQDDGESKGVQKPEDDTEAPATPSQPASRESIIEKARKFLQEDEVRDSSTDKKIAFLEGKGLNSVEIEELLGVPKIPEALSEVSCARYII